MRARVRVLLICASLDILGGQAVIARRLIDGFAHDADIEIEFVPINPRLPAGLRWMQSIKYVRTLSTSVAYVLSLLRTVPRSDVLHVFSASYFAYLIAALPALIIGRLFGRRVILNYHSGEAADHLSRWPMSRWTMRRVPHAVIVPSDYLVKVFGDFGIQAQSIVNFVDVDEVGYRERRQLRPHVFSNRNLELLYNVACSIRAFGRVQASFPDATLIVAGEGSQRPELERLVGELGLRNVTFVGRVSPDEMIRYYNQCDIYINSSDIDNMPLSIIEAFAAGLPVVSTSAGGIPFVVRDGVTGRLVPLGDDAAMAEAVSNYLRDPEVALRFARAARQECEERYVWQRVRDAWVSIYRRLAG